MKTLFRTLLYLCLIVWLGAEIFFPVVAAFTFGTLSADTHTAGSIVGGLLHILHNVGMITAVVAIALLALTPAWGIYKLRYAVSAIVLLVFMFALTAYSQFAITSAMEKDRVAAGGDIRRAEPDNPARRDFERLHIRSEHVEEAILLAGLLVVVLVAHAESQLPAPKHEN
jgi:hypothetical protein